MMEKIYIAALLFAAMAFIRLCIVEPRRAILAGLTFTTLALPALPWKYITFSGIGFALSIVFVVASLFYAVVKGRVSTKYIANNYNLAIIGLAIALCGYTIISEAQEYGLVKSSLFIVKIVLPTIAFSVLAPFPLQDRKTIIATIVAASILTVLSLFSTPIFEQAGLYDRATGADRLNPITVGRIVGFSIVVLFLYGFNHKARRLLFVASLAIIPVLSIGIITTGSRGPIAAAVIAIALMLLTINTNIRNKFATLSKLSVLTFVLVGIGMTTNLGSQLEDLGGYRRIEFYLTGTGNKYSNIDRTRRLEAAWEGTIESVGLGIGSGGFAAIYGYGEREYPHNLVLEIGLELGLLGLAILAFLMFIVIKELVRNRPVVRVDFTLQAAFALWVYSFSNSMVSADIYGNQEFWIIGALSVLFFKSIARKNLQTSR